MDQDKNAYAQYRASFPGDAFLKKYFGEDHIVAVNTHRAEIDEIFFLV